MGSIVTHDEMTGKGYATILIKACIAEIEKKEEAYIFSVFRYQSLNFIKNLALDHYRRICKKTKRALAWSGAQNLIGRGLLSSRQTKFQTIFKKHPFKNRGLNVLTNPARPIGFRRLLRARTVAQFESANYRRLQATVRPDAADFQANCRCSAV